MEEMLQQTDKTKEDFYSTFDERYPFVKEDCYTYWYKNEAGFIYEMMREFYFYCEKYELKPTFSFGKVFVTSKNADKWYFIPRKGKITLMHKNHYYKDVGEYHKQFTKEITMEQLATYMNEHDRAKYTSEFVNFSTKQ